MELAYVDVDDEYAGSVIQKLGERKGELLNMHTNSGGSTRLEFSIPSRGLIGYRGEFMTDTKGTGVLNTIFNGYEPYKGDIQYRKQGSLIAFESGESITYGLFNAQERVRCSSVPARGSTPAWWWDKTASPTTSSSTSARPRS